MRKNKISSRSCLSKLQPFVVLFAPCAALLWVEIAAFKKTAVDHSVIVCLLLVLLLQIDLSPGCLQVVLILWMSLYRAADSFRYSCDICGKKYKYYSCFQEHRDLHAVDGNPEDFSSVCILTFGISALYLYINREQKTPTLRLVP